MYPTQCDNHVVADNSKNREARAEHRRICTERGVPYVELPKRLTVRENLTCSLSPSEP